MRIAHRLSLPLVAAPLLACTGHAVPPAAPPPVVAPPAAPATIALVAEALPLPGATGAVSLDYLAVDRAERRVWIPAGNTGSVDVLDESPLRMTRIEGFPTVEREGHSGKRVVGPSSATIGGGFAYVGNRADAQVCALDAVNRAHAGCVKLHSAPDGILYVAATKEVWATTPKEHSIQVLDASAPATLSVKATIVLEGSPEGYAVDEGRGLFYTNLEDKDKTVVLDVRAHKVTATWEARCGGEGPRGLAVDAARGFLFVACTDRVQSVDAAHGGAPLGQLVVGEGVDNIDYLAAQGQLYVAAGKAGLLTVAHVDDKGAIAAIGSAPTAPGTRVVVAGADGTAYVADGKQGRVIVVRAATAKP